MDVFTSMSIARDELPKNVVGWGSDDFKYEYFQCIERVVNAVRMTALKTLSIPHILKKWKRRHTDNPTLSYTWNTIENKYICTPRGKHNYSIDTKRENCCYTQNVGFRWAAVGCRYVTAVMRLSDHETDRSLPWQRQEAATTANLRMRKWP